MAPRVTELRITREQIVSCKPCSARYLKFFDASPRAGENDDLVFPLPWEAEETLRLMRLSPAMTFWLSQRKLIPVSFLECQAAQQVVLEERRKAGLGDRDTPAPKRAKGKKSDP